MDVSHGPVLIVSTDNVRSRVCNIVLIRSGSPASAVIETGDEQVGVRILRDLDPRCPPDDGLPFAIPGHAAVLRYIWTAGRKSEMIF